MNKKDLLAQVSSNSIYYERKNYYIDFLKKILKNKGFIFPTIIILIIFITGFITHKFINENIYLNIDLTKSFISPCLKYPFGTNEFGQNQFFIIMNATYKTLLLAMLVTFIDLIFGIIIGCFWAKSKIFEKIMFVIKNLFDNTPTIFFLIIISLIFKKGFFPLLIILIFFQWIEFAFITRNNIIALKSKDYNIVSNLYNVPFYKVIINNYLPSLLPILFNNVALSVSKIINLEVTVSYFGFTIGGKSDSLGTLIYHSLSNNTYFLHLYIFLIPFAVLFIINLCIFAISKTISKTFTKEEQGC